MFDALKRLFSDLKARAPEPTFALDDPRLAVAALMCHVIAVDGVVRPAERTAMIATLADRYGLTTAEAGQLAEAAREAELETAALKRFTAGLARSLPIEERRDIVSRAEIDAYAGTGEPLDKAGAYGIQGVAAVFVSRLEGSYSGVMGLPLHETAELLREAGLAIPRTP